MGLMMVSKNWCGCCTTSWLTAHHNILLCNECAEKTWEDYSGYWVITLKTQFISDVNENCFSRYRKQLDSYCFTYLILYRYHSPLLLYFLWKSPLEQKRFARNVSLYSRSMTGHSVLIVDNWASWRIRKKILKWLNPVGLVFKKIWWMVRPILQLNQF